MVSHPVLRAASVALLASVVVVHPLGAQDGTPVASPAPVDPSQCTVEPRSAEELRALLAAGLAEQAEREAPRAATPASPTPSMAAAAPSRSGAADPATVAAIAAVAREVYACANAGDLPAMLALMTDETAANYLVGLAGSPGPAGGGTPSPATVTPALVDALLETLAVPAPPPSSSWRALVELRDVRVLEDGRIRATVVSMSPLTSPESYDGVVAFCWADGRYRWHVGGSRGCGER